MVFTSSAPVATIVADRHEVPNADQWDHSSGSDFFFRPDAAQIAGTGNAEDLSDRGWTITGSATYVPGVGGDFLSSADKGVPSHYLLDAAGDIIQSPALFGNHTDGEQAGHHLGNITPTSLTATFEASFADASNNETASGIGFSKAGLAINVATSHYAVIFSDGTNFGLRSSGATDLGAVVDNAVHHWDIVLSGSTAEWYMDDVSQGSIALLTDVFPLSWGAGILAATGANDIQMGDCRIYYR